MLYAFSRSIVIRYRNIRLAESWKDLYAAFSALEKLEVTGPYLGFFRHALIDGDTSSEESDRAQPASPNFKRMRLPVHQRVGSRARWLREVC